MSKRKTIPRPEIIWRLVPSNEICQQLGISYSTLKRWRKAGTIIEGIHYGFLPGSRTNILWNLDLMRCFVQNSGSTAHDRSIERFIASLPNSGTNAPSASKNRAHL
jgi:hypothetical protein